MIKKRFLIYLGTFIFLISTLAGCGGGGGGDAAAPAYSQADLTGTWQGHFIVSGDGSDDYGWYRGVWSIDGSGNSTVSNLVYDNYTVSIPDHTWSITSNGVLSTPLFPSFHGFLSINKLIFVGTGTDGPGHYTIGTLQKKVVGITYTIADLQGTWQGHCLVSGDGSNNNGWYRGVWSSDGSGNATVTNIVYDNYSVSIPDFTWSITSDGIIGASSFPSFYGFLSADKRIIVGTGTDGPGHYTLCTFQKEVAGTTYTTADLHGTWQVHAVVSGDSPQWLGWYRFVDTYNASGYSAGTSSVVRSNGDTTAIPAHTMSITSDGIVTDSGFGTLNGFMSADKRTIIGTATDGGGGYTIITFQKQ